MESFYGGRQGNSIVVVRRFDMITLPEDGLTYYRRKCVLALKKIYNTTTTYYIIVKAGNPIYFNESVDGVRNKNLYTIKSQLNDSGVMTVSVTDDTYTLKATNSTNVEFKIGWVYLDAQTEGTTSPIYYGYYELTASPSIVNSTTQHGTITLPVEELEGMTNFFAKQIDTLKDVNYGQCVMIDTVMGLGDFHDGDNGKIYRRGYGSSVLISEENNFGEADKWSAEYIGQIVGPTGNSPEYILGYYSELENLANVSKVELTNKTDVYSSKDFYNSSPSEQPPIAIAIENIEDRAGNITTYQVGFKLPRYETDWYVNKTASTPYVEPDIIVHEMNNYYYQNELIIPPGKHGADVYDLFLKYNYNGTIFFNQYNTSNYYYLNSSKALTKITSSTTPNLSTIQSLLKKETDGNTTYCTFCYRIKDYETSAEGNISEPIEISPFRSILDIDVTDNGTIIITYNDTVVRWDRELDYVDELQFSTSGDDSGIISYTTRGHHQTGDTVYNILNPDNPLIWITSCTQDEKTRAITLTFNNNVILNGTFGKTLTYQGALPKEILYTDDKFYLIFDDQTSSNDGWPYDKNEKALSLGEKGTKYYRYLKICDVPYRPKDLLYKNDEIYLVWDKEDSDGWPYNQDSDGEYTIAGDYLNSIGVKHYLCKKIGDLPSIENYTFTFEKGILTITYKKPSDNNTKTIFETELNYVSDISLDTQTYADDLIATKINGTRTRFTGVIDKLEDFSVEGQGSLIEQTTQNNNVSTRIIKTLDDAYLDNNELRLFYNIHKYFNIDNQELLNSLSEPSSGYYSIEAEKIAYKDILSRKLLNWIINNFDVDEEDEQANNTKYISKTYMDYIIDSLIESVSPTVYNCNIKYSLNIKNKTSENTIKIMDKNIVDILKSFIKLKKANQGIMVPSQEESYSYEFIINGNSFDWVEILQTMDKNYDASRWLYQEYEKKDNEVGVITYQNFINTYYPDIILKIDSSNKLTYAGYGSTGLAAIGTSENYVDLTFQNCMYLLFTYCKFFIEAELRNEILYSTYTKIQAKRSSAAVSTKESKILSLFSVLGTITTSNPNFYNQLGYESRITEVEEEDVTSNWYSLLFSCCEWLYNTNLGNVTGPAPELDFKGYLAYLDNADIVPDIKIWAEPAEYSEDYPNKQSFNMKLVIPTCPNISEELVKSLFPDTINPDSVEDEAFKDEMYQYCMKTQLAAEQAQAAAAELKANYLDIIKDLQDNLATLEKIVAQYHSQSVVGTAIVNTDETVDSLSNALNPNLTVANGKLNITYQTEE